MTGVVISAIAMTAIVALRYLASSGLFAWLTARRRPGFYAGLRPQMLREIGRTFGYATRQYPDQPLTAVRLTGGGASLPGLAERFSETLGVATALAGDADAPAAMTLAVGLAQSEGAR